MPRTLSHQEAQTHYDAYGLQQDHAPFEEPALDLLLANGRFDSAHTLFEFGCGTGKVARRLFENYLPPDATYLGSDASQTMVDITRERLIPYGERAQVVQTEGPIRFPLPDQSADRCLSTYVLDLLSEADIARFFDEAARILQPGGLLTLSSLTHGQSLGAKLKEFGWMLAYRLRPQWVGGCRPIDLQPFVAQSGAWHTLFQETITVSNLSSEILIAQKPA